MNFTIRCKYSGLVIGQLQYETLAGYQPWLSHWKDMQAIHPAFSMPTNRLLAFTRGTYENLIKASEDGEATEAENDLLRVSWLACLHSLGSIRQEAVALPNLDVVHKTMKKLVALAYWKHILNSQRFNFPIFKINRINANTRFDNIDYYIEACFDLRKEYENGITELEEIEKKKRADAALAALRSSWVIPVSNRALWKWVRAHLPAKYEADAQGWMSTLFLGNEKTVCEFDADEVDLMDQIICGECPQGTGILSAVRARIEAVKKMIVDNRTAFDVDLTDFAIPEAQKEDPEPVRKDFSSEGKYIRARAIWWLGQQELRKKQEAPKPIGDLPDATL